MVTLICDKCGKSYPDLFDTIARIDYAEPGKGKPYEFHLCVSCRKQLVGWITNQ